MLNPWPLKNHILLGAHTCSTWEGYNLADDTGIPSEVPEEMVSGPLKRQAWEARIENPERWLRQIGRNHAARTRASDAQPYLDTIRRPVTSVYVQCASLRRRLLLLDTRPRLKAAFPDLSTAVRLGREPRPLTLFGLVLLRLLMSVSPASAFSRSRE